jgi:predicted nucleic acid-binding protein
MIACVVDASVIARWFVGDPQAAPVRAARGMRAEALAGQLECHAPRLLFVEVANAIWKECRFGSLPPLEARALIQDLSVLDVVAHDHDPLLPDAFELALAHGLTVYDAMYVALALKRQLPLWTQDARLARNASGVVDVRAPWGGV